MTRSHSEEDYFVGAREALAAGDVETATSQLAAALATAPRNEAALLFLEALAEREPKLLERLEPRERPFFGEVALGARLLAARGRWASALTRLLEVVTFRPDVPYLVWFDAWLPRCDVASLPLDALGPALSEFVTALGTRPLDDGARAENAQRALDLVRRLLDVHANHERLGLLAITLLRRLGDGEAACRAATELFAARPSWRTAVTAANAHLDVHAFRRALDYYRRASEIDPRNPATYLDAADLLLHLGELDEAEKQYLTAFRLDPGSIWASAALAVVRYRREPSATNRAAVVEWARHSDVGARVAELLDATD